MAGDAETGMMVMKMDKGLDTGPVALTRKVTIGLDMTAGELHDALSLVGAEAMVEAMAKLEAGTLETVTQADEGVLYAAKIDKAETRVDFTRPATEVHNHIRGLAPFPGAWTEMDVNGKPERVKLLASSLAEGQGAIAAPGTALDDHLTIACGTGAVSLVRLQKAGGKALSAEDFLRGTPLPKGTVIA
jgi:methionyl-tRNA formyltransferase